jgi:hypothetical protein
MPIEGIDLELLKKVASHSAFLTREQQDQLNIVKAVQGAISADQTTPILQKAFPQAQIQDTSAFERAPDLAAAAYYLLSTSQYAATSDSRQTLKALRTAIHQSMSPYLGRYSIQSTFAVEFRMRALMRESPTAFYGLMDFVQHQQNRTLAGLDSELQGSLLGGYRFGNRDLLDIFGLLTHHRDPVPKAVRIHLLIPKNLARFDQMVRDETSTPEMPRGVSIEQGIRILFANRGIQPVHREMVTGIRYRTVDVAGSPSLAVRSPGSGIRFFVELSSSQKNTTEQLKAAYARFRDTGSGIDELKSSLENYFANALGRRLPMEEIWPSLRRGVSGFPVRAAIIEALGVRPAEFDYVMTRAGEASVLKELRREDKESKGKREAVRGK